MIIKQRISQMQTAKKLITDRIKLPKKILTYRILSIYGVGTPVALPQVIDSIRFRQNENQHA